MEKMEKSLEMFKLFHYLKEITTKSYSLKKLQDIIERRIDSNIAVSEGEYMDFVGQFNEIDLKLRKALKDLEEIVN